MRTLSVFLLLACLSIGAAAQEKPAAKLPTVSDGLPAKYTAIKLQVGELLNIYNPMLSLAVERRMGIVGVQLGASIGYPRNYSYGDSINPSRAKTFGYGLNAEGRVYRRARLQSRINQFAGIRTGVNYYNTPFTNYYSDTTFSSGMYDGYSHTVSRTKTVFICALIAGVQFRSDNVIVELGGGLGYKCKWITDEGKANVQYPYALDFGRHEFIRSSDKEGGAIALPIIINLCYSF